MQTNRADTVAIFDNGVVIIYKFFNFYKIILNAYKIMTQACGEQPHTLAHCQILLFSRRRSVAPSNNGRALFKGLCRVVHSKV